MGSQPGNFLSVTPQDGTNRPIRPLKGWNERKITFLLGEAGFSKAEVGRILGVSQQAVQKAIKNADSRPICYFVAGILRVPPGRIWGRFRAGRG